MKEKKKRNRHIVRTLLALILTASMIPIPAYASTSTAKDDGTFTNPVIYADVPDVDVLKVGDTYYMVSTTMHLSPGVPIMKSKDLVNWEIVNYVYNIMDDGDALSLRNGQNAYGKGSWASSLRFHDGLYYLVFGSYTTGKTYVYTTDDIENGVWAHTELNTMYHDMSLLFDDDGKIYMTYVGGNIKAVEMEKVENGLKVKPGSEITVIDDVWKGSPIQGQSFLYGEGTHFQKINGKYYIFVISWPPVNEEAGTKGMRTELCFRADSIEDFKNGNWERKIILADKGAAQGGIFEVGDKWYGMVFRDMGPVGRCPVLVPVTWTDGWPMMGNKDGKVDDTMTIPLPQQEEKSIVTSDEFYNDAKRPSYTRQQELNNSMGKAMVLSENDLMMASVSKGDELLSNRGFDDGTNNWTVNDTAELEVVKDGDNNVLKVSGRKTTGSGPRQDITGSIVEGATYKVTAKVKYDHEAGPARKTFNMCIFNGKSYVNGDSIQVMGSGSANKGEWGTITGTFTVKEGTDVSQSAIFIESAWAANPTADNDLFDFYVDDVSVVAENVPVVEGENLIRNGSFEENLDDWEAREGSIVLDTTEKVSGESSVKVYERKVTGSGPQQDMSGLVEPGDILDISYHIKYTDGPDKRRFILTAFDGKGNYTNLVGADVVKGEWTKISGSFTVPDNMDTSNLKFFTETSWVQNPTPEKDIMDYYVDDMVITRRVVEAPKDGENDYNGSNLKLEWQWNHNPNNNCWSLTDRPGYLRLTTGNISTSLTEARNTLSQRTYAPQCSGQIAMEVDKMKNGDVAGLTAFAAKYGYVGVRMTGGEKYLVMVGTKELGGDKFEPYEAEAVKLEQDRVYLKIDFNYSGGNKAYFYYSLDGKTWTKIGDDLGMIYSLAHFMGYRLGLFNYATRSTGGYVDFDYFRIEDGNSGTTGTTPVGEASMENKEATGVTNVELEIPVKMESLPKGNYKSLKASFGIPSQLEVTDVVFNEKNVTGTSTYSFTGNQLIMTVNGKDVGYTATASDDVFATIKVKVADYVSQDTNVTIAADYIETTGDKASYDVSKAKSVVTLKYLNMNAVAKKPGTSNPLMDHKYGADPYAMEYNGRVYIYMTNDSQEYDKTNGATDNTYGSINTINVISSADMVNWTDHGSIPVGGKRNPDGAAKWASNSWAPAATHKTIDGKEKFFLYFADSANGIGVLEADSPIGPFKDPIGKALISRGIQASEGVEWLFDPAVLLDDDGTGYLYYGGGVPEGQAQNPKTGRVVKLGDDMTSLAGDAKMIDAPRLFEDSGIHKYNGKYYYSYCSNFNGYEAEGYPGSGIICYMESDSPMGPFTYKGEILQNPSTFFGVGGNNHHAIFEFNGQHYITYHAQTLGKAINNVKGYRSTHINKVDINANGSINTITADMKGISQLQTADPYERLEAETIAWNSGIKTAVCKEQGSLVKELNMELTDIQNGDWTAIAGLDFGIKGAKTFTANIAPKAGGTIEIRLDSTQGTLVGTLEVPKGDETYRKLQCEVKDITGEHNVFFVFKGDANADSLMKADYWQFAESTAVTVDKSKLKAAIDKAQEVDVDKYTEESLGKMQEALAEAKKVYDNDKATQAQADKAAKDLEDAVKNLVEKETVNKAALKKVIDDAKAKDTTKYTEDSVKKMQAALTEAEKVYADGKATQAQVDKAAKDLTDAVKNLVEKEEVNKAALKKAIDDAKAKDTTKYSKDSVKKMEAALTEAEKIYADDKATQSQVDEAEKDLKDAVEDLKESVVSIFKDITDKDWYIDYAQYVYDREIMTGLDDEHFGGAVDLSRAHFATILYRMEGKPEAKGGKEFPDVQDGAFYAEAVAWASSEEVGVINGYKDGSFGPADLITREQLATMMYRYAEYKGFDTSATSDLKEFEDRGKVSEFADKAMKWAVGSKIITGDQGLLNPQGKSSRAVCATIIQRFMEKYN